MQRLLAAAAATTVLAIATAASAQPYRDHPGAPYAPSASGWRTNPYGAAGTPYRDDRAYYGGARYDYGARHSYDSAIGPTRPYGAYGYAPNRTYGGWGARFTLPFRSHAPSHR
ncbi:MULTISPECIES: hypothetical protein [unclassified Phenylobacterium]|jgi:hypothetical protein|uniref:hypothetical protein n=1 Tax=unclassified Phenylobacterium TaxID=2640670 RepID=UPI000B06024E|nr:MULTISPECIES: hypothetical protein [unclassified Phenylobacterium]